MRVDPCATRVTDDLCCDGSNEGACEDNPEFESGTDIGVAWFLNGYVLHCGETYQETGQCGTYLEIHRPADPTIIDEQQIERSYESGYATEFVSTKKLCAGRYEFWYVV